MTSKQLLTIFCETIMNSAASREAIAGQRQKPFLNPPGCHCVRRAPSVSGGLMQNTEDFVESKSLSDSNQ